MTASTAPASGTRHPKLLNDVDQIIDFVTGGNATFTIKNRNTGARATYKVVARENDDDVLTHYDVYAFVGNDNEDQGQYRLLGVMDVDGTWTPWTEARRALRLRNSAGTNPVGHWVDNKLSFLDRCVQTFRAGRTLSKAQSYRYRSACNKYKLPPVGEFGKVKRTAYPWTWDILMSGKDLPGVIEIWHVGSCCHCSKRLTVPASIELGKGLDCASQRKQAEQWKLLDRKLGRDLVNYAESLKVSAA
jgi:hypothetical protein